MYNPFIGIDFQVQIIFSAILFYPTKNKYWTNTNEARRAINNSSSRILSSVHNIFHFLFVQYNI